jgi:hypothetical protein
MPSVSFHGGPLDGEVKERTRFPSCLAEDGVAALPANTYQRRDDLYLHRLVAPGDGTRSHQYIHGTRDLNTGEAR